MGSELERDIQTAIRSVCLSLSFFFHAFLFENAPSIQTILSSFYMLNLIMVHPLSLLFTFLLVAFSLEWFS